MSVERNEALTPKRTMVVTAGVSADSALLSEIAQHVSNISIEGNTHIENSAVSQPMALEGELITLSKKLRDFQHAVLVLHKGSETGAAVKAALVAQKITQTVGGFTLVQVDGGWDRSKGSFVYHVDNVIDSNPQA